MAAEDELVIPTVPEARPEDPEDVSWALSTAEAMWARGDHAEGIKWVRRAAEAASEAEDDERALELAKAAAELAALVARRSLADSAPPSSKKELGKSTMQSPQSNAPSTARSGAPPVSRPSAPPAPKPASAPAPAKPISKPPPPVPAKQAAGGKAGRSVPPAPIPLPSRASQAPRAPQAATGPARGPAAGKGVLSNRPPADQKEKKGRRRSRENLEAEARAAGVLELSSSSPDIIEERPYDPRNVSRSLDSDATIVGHVDEIKERARSAEDWDRSPTQNTTGNPIEEPEEAARMTSVGAPPAARPPAATVHDPKIQTSQAIRVVVWRDAHGVHIAPAGTVVTALTIDAVLVSLEPTADLTAWLSARAK